MQLAQKYRQTKLSDIVGHKQTVKELINRVRKKEIPQAIYITGESGQGKTTIARIIGMIVNCESGMEEPCCVCESCKSVLDESFHREIKELNASNLDIDRMRELENDASIQSFFNEKKVWIINEFQELSGNPKARKNILSLLENKNDNIHIIITSMDDSKTDIAIKRRCVPFNLKSPTVEEIGSYLIHICEMEGVKLSEKEIEVIVLIAQNSNGSVGIALSYLDKIMNGELWDSELAHSELGIVTQENLLSILGDILSGKAQALSNPPTKEIIEKIKWNLISCMKTKLGVSNDYERKQLGKLPDLFPIERFKFVLDQLMELYTLSFIDSFAIQNWVMNCIFPDKETNKSQEVIEEKPIRGRGR